MAMTKTRVVRFAAALAVVLVQTSAQAKDISTKKLLIKDHDDHSKRQILIQSLDPSVSSSDVGSPNSSRTAVHVYSATDDECIFLDSDGTQWTEKNGQWKYVNKATGTSAQVKDSKLQIKIKSGIDDYSLEDDGNQGAVNVRVQFGASEDYCMRCAVANKDDSKQFNATNCTAASCDPEPSSCDPTAPTTTTSTTTTTTSPPSTVELKAVLQKTTGRFNYNLTVGLAGADAACEALVAGTHACSYSELLEAEAAGDLVGVKDTLGNPVTSFWAIDTTHDHFTQCWTLVAWDYETLHTGHKAESVNLNNATGDLDPVAVGTLCGTQRWVGCCP